MEPLVSIVIPCRNAAPWLAACLDSVVGQMWPRYEAIVVDDGSGDNSCEIASRYAGRHVLLMSQDPEGASAARNRALRIAQGDFIQFLDADDLLHPEKIRRQLNLLQRSHAGCVALSSIVHFADGSDPLQGLVDEGWPMRNADHPVEWLLDLHGGNGTYGMVQTAQWLVPRAVADQAGPWDDMLTVDDDGEYFARIVLASRGLRFARESIVYFRKHSNGANLSALGQQSLRFRESALQSLRMRATYLLEVHDDRRTRRALSGAFSRLAVSAYPDQLPIYRAACTEIARLGGPFVVPPLGRRTDRLRRLLGWKMARRLSAWLRGGSFREHQ